jgi:uncharacterized protein
MLYDVKFTPGQQAEYSRDADKFLRLLKDERIGQDYLMTAYPRSLCVSNSDCPLLFEIVTGSRLYGNHTDESDYDYRGVYLEPNYFLLSQSKFTEHIQLKQEELDIEYYSLTKLKDLLLSGNPNSQELLFAPSDAYTYLSPRGLYLKSMRQLFLAKDKIYHSYLGYANSQLKRIRGHNKWLNKFPDIHFFVEVMRKAYENKDISEVWIKDYTDGALLELITGKKQNNCGKTDHDNTSPRYLADKYYNGDLEAFSKYLSPKEKDFVYLRDTELQRLNIQDNMEFLNTWATYRKLSNEQFMIYSGGNGIFTREGQLKGNTSGDAEHLRFIMTYDSGAYKAKVTDMHNLYVWISNRNGKRAELEKNHGYDTKHASHCVRLMISGIEILENSDFNPRLSSSNLELIKSIRRGDLSYDEILAFSDDLKLRMDVAFENSMLPKKVDVDKVHALIYRLRE